MKNTGIIRHLDDLGRIVIPKELRKKYKIEEGTPIEIFTKGNEIILKKQKNRTCLLCESECELEDKYCRHCGYELDISKE